MFLTMEKLERSNKTADLADSHTDQLPVIIKSLFIR